MRASRAGRGARARVSLGATKEIVGCAEKTIARAARAGRIRHPKTSNHAGPSLERRPSRSSRARAADPQAREKREPARERPGPPDDGHICPMRRQRPSSFPQRIPGLATRPRRSRFRQPRRTAGSGFRRDQTDQRAAALVPRRDSQTASPDRGPGQLSVPRIRHRSTERYAPHTTLISARRIPCAGCAQRSHATCSRRSFRRSMNCRVDRSEENHCTLPWANVVSFAPR